LDELIPYPRLPPQTAGLIAATKILDRSRPLIYAALDWRGSTGGYVQSRITF